MIGPDGATVIAPMRLTGVVRTSKGFAVAQVTFGPDGAVISAALGRSQALKEFVALEHKRILVLATQKA